MPPLPAPARSRGDLFVVSAPSGAGKTTLLRKLLGRVDRVEFSVSFTTRKPRRGEREGVDYHFISPVRFRRMARGGEFLEWARVYDHLYGTGREQIDRILDAGIDALLDLDTQGAAAVRRKLPKAVLIFILPPSAAALERRLRGRGLDGPAAVRRRLAKAAGEIRRYPRYDYLIVNDRVEKALRSLEAVLLAHRCRRTARRREAKRILDSF